MKTLKQVMAIKRIPQTKPTRKQTNKKKPQAQRCNSQLKNFDNAGLLAQSLKSGTLE